jgi:hypothetical protein
MYARGYVHLGSDASCCSWHCRRAARPLDEAECNGHGHAMGVLGGADRSDISFDRLLSGVTIKSVSPYWSISGNATGSEFGFGQWQHRDLTATRCEQACLASARCTSFSMTTAGGIPSCVFCSACELRKDPGWQSWLRSEGDGRLRRAQPVTHRTLQPLLQSA